VENAIGGVVGREQSEKFFGGVAVDDGRVTFGGTTLESGETVTASS